MMLAGFVSMPIMTRVLDKSEYGKLALVLLAATLSSSVLQLGMPQGLIRFIPEFSRRQENVQRTAAERRFPAAPAVCSAPY